MEVESIIHQERAGALAQYPHAKRVGSLVFVSGVSSRRADNTHEGPGPWPRACPKGMLSAYIS